MVQALSWWPGNTAFVYRNLNMENFKKIIFSTVKTNAMILFIIVGAMLLGYIMTILQIPQNITKFATDQDISPWVISSNAAEVPHHPDIYSYFFSKKYIEKIEGNRKKLY